MQLKTIDDLRQEHKTKYRLVDIIMPLMNAELRRGKTIKRINNIDEISIRGSTGIAAGHCCGIGKDV